MIRRIPLIPTRPFLGAITPIIVPIYYTTDRPDVGHDIHIPGSEDAHRVTRTVRWQQLGTYRSKSSRGRRVRSRGRCDNVARSICSFRQSAKIGKRTRGYIVVVSGALPLPLPSRSLPAPSRILLLLRRPRLIRRTPAFSVAPRTRPWDSPRWWGDAGRRVGATKLRRTQPDVSYARAIAQLSRI